MCVVTAADLDDLLIHAKTREEAVIFTPPNGWDLVPPPSSDVPVMPYFIEDGDELLDDEST